MTHMNDVRQIQMRGQRREVVGVVIHVVAVADLTGSSMAVPVMGDDPISVLRGELHRGVPVVS
jgi:hypothetical protein